MTRKNQPEFDGSKTIAQEAQETAMQNSLSWLAIGLFLMACLGFVRWMAGG